MEAKQVKGLMEAYASVYTNISESHFKVGDEVICKDSGKEGEVIKVDPEEKGKYYTVKREDGKTMKYAPDELKIEKEEDEKEDEKEDMKEAKNGGVDKKTETKFHKKLDTLVHKTFGEREEEKKMKEDVDLFDYLLEYLVAEGYADTNKAALAIMANMSEEWKQSIVEDIRGNSTLTPVGKAIGTGVGILKGAMGSIKSGGGYSTRPGDGKPYKDGPLWGPGSSSTPKTPVKKPSSQAPMRDEPLW